VDTPENSVSVDIPVSESVDILENEEIVDSPANEEIVVLVDTLV
jgi:hypothetical protein